MKHTLAFSASFLVFCILLRGDARLQTTEAVSAVPTPVAADTAKPVSHTPGDPNAVFQPYYDPATVTGIPANPATVPARSGAASATTIPSGPLTLEVLEQSVAALYQRIDNLDRRLAQVENVLTRNPRAGVPEALPAGSQPIIGQPVVGGSNNPTRPENERRNNEIRNTREKNSANVNAAERRKSEKERESEKEVEGNE